MTVTFYPGATLVNNYTKDDEQKYDITTSLEKAGFSAEEIEAAQADQRPQAADAPQAHAAALDAEARTLAPDDPRGNQGLGG